MKSFLLLILTGCLTSAPLWGREIEGVAIPEQIQVAGTTLTLNGAGLRSFTLLFVPIKVYVAALYTPTPLRSEQSVAASPGPIQFDFTFLRAVGQSDVTKAWISQFAQSVGYTYPGYEKDRDAFIALFGPLQNGGVERVQLIGDKTLITDSGVSKGTISGRNFQRAFLSLWFGSSPVAPDLRDALLGLK